MCETECCPFMRRYSLAVKLKVSRVLTQRLQWYRGFTIEVVHV